MRIPYNRPHGMFTSHTHTRSHNISRTNTPNVPTWPVVFRHNSILRCVFCACGSIYRECVRRARFRPSLIRMSRRHARRERAHLPVVLYTRALRVRHVYDPQSQHRRDPRATRRHATGLAIFVTFLPRARKPLRYPVRKSTENCPRDSRLPPAKAVIFLIEFFGARAREFCMRTHVAHKHTHRAAIVVW